VTAQKATEYVLAADLFSVVPRAGTYLRCPGRAGTAVLLSAVRKVGGDTTKPMLRLILVSRRREDPDQRAKVWLLRDGEIGQDRPQRASSVKQDATRHKHIPQIAETIRTSLDTGGELDALVKLPIAQQKILITKAASGEKVSAKNAVKKVTRDQRENGTWQTAPPKHPTTSAPRSTASSTQTHHDASNHIPTKREWTEQQTTTIQP
jgi:hypothetical protein